VVAWAVAWGAVPWAVAVEAERTICVDFDVGAVVGRVARVEGIVDPTIGVVVVVVELGVEEGAGGVEAKAEVAVEAEAIVGAGAEAAAAERVEAAPEAAAAEGVEAAPEPPETPDIGLAILAATPVAKLGAKTAAIDKGLENSPPPMPSLFPAIITTKQWIATGLGAVDSTRVRVRYGAASVAASSRQRCKAATADGKGVIRVTARGSAARVLVESSSTPGVVL
jgi:hypothetical protein